MNYYKILEVDKDASPEVIEKAYKALVKKYHPDLQESNMRQNAEERIKLINEAYEVLSNPISKAKYDETLSKTELSEEDFDRLSKENKNLHDEINNLKYHSNVNYNNTQQNSYQQVDLQNEYEKQLKYENELQQARQKAYHDAYIQDLKNRGYKIKYKKSPKDYLKNILALLITIGILFILWHIPFIHDFFMNTFNNNPIFKAIINILE